ncbi:integrase core domain-containing protein [Streptomyces sp. NPDC047009]|uniref:integrase core domain-containing protein n=1 Tax=Streptomyces sp. NPDC047009 TaxID=3154496 RepID=UPI0033E98E69
MTLRFQSPPVPLQNGCTGSDQRRCSDGPVGRPGYIWRRRGGLRHQGPWRDFDEVERAVFQWVAWYDSKRVHSALGYVPPDEYEQAYWEHLEEAPQTA